MLKTEILRIDPHQPEPPLIEKAASVLLSGGLVVFPTETVYGLGADAMNADAVGRIFDAKGRPACNPLICHVESAAGAREIVADWPEIAARLAARFWPGPLTLILPRAARLPAAVTAGGPTVAVRAPAHPVALALLRAVGRPVAAPSANRSTRLSPTRAERAFVQLKGRVELILDAGPTPRGLESTVLDLTARPPRVLRPGPVSIRALEEALGMEVAGRESHSTGKPDAQAPARSPGLMGRHYAPLARLECASPEAAEARIRELLAAGRRAGWLRLHSGDEALAHPNLITRVAPRDPESYGAALYEILHCFDEAGVETIVVESPPAGDEWQAARDRLRRASALAPDGA